MKNNEAIVLCERVLDPDDLGYAVTQEVRREARSALQVAGMRPADESSQTTSGKPVKIYLAGPMSGLPEYNFPAFFQAAEFLRERGLIVENPAEHAQRNSQPSWEGYMRQSIKILMMCDEFYLLPGWNKSSGACLELMLACALKMPVHEPETWCPEDWPDPWRIYGR